MAAARVPADAVLGRMAERLSSLDRRFLDCASRLGAAGVGTTAPNPSVGAIVVRGRVVVARGRTAVGGRPHGEAVALAQAGEKATGGTLYVSLEPCAHHGKTPPCADAICAAGVGRVVIGAGDPDPRVGGRGIAKLRDGGIGVAVAPDATGAANRGHVMRMTRGRPHVTLKLAVSADGAIGRRGEGQVAITGAIARRHAQALRTRYDAVLVGTGTAAADNPRLTCRLPGLEDRSPIRIVAGDFSALADNLHLLCDDGPPTWLLTAGDHRQPGPAPRFRVIRASGGDGGIDWPAALLALGDAGLTTILVEGGARIARSLLETGCADTVFLFRSPGTVGAGGVPALAGLDPDEVENGRRYRRIDRRWFGEDWLTRYERVRAADASKGTATGVGTGR